MHRGLDEHQVKKRSFAFTVGYIYCFRTYSVYLSLRLPAQILYAGIHLPPQREARALPRRALKWTASERKLVTKETHQGCLSFLFKSPLLCKGEARALPRRHRIAKVRAAVKPAVGGLPSSATVQRQGAAPRHLPQGEGKSRSEAAGFHKKIFPFVRL